MVYVCRDNKGGPLVQPYARPTLDFGGPTQEGTPTRLQACCCKTSEVSAFPASTASSGKASFTQTTGHNRSLAC